MSVMGSAKKIRKVWRLRRFGFPEESPVRDYVWGFVIVAFGALSIFGILYLLGR